MIWKIVPCEAWFAFVVSLPFFAGLGFYCLVQFFNHDAHSGLVLLFAAFCCFSLLVLALSSFS